ncbi:UNVERIFIED_CONTAM: hypothetical protein Slati_2907000 [Sesamum latifolium]|uniref:Reverse transcriptase zinc-binding domain-containing protein n=1 Tax=Sesamum latifolium TaxID=2727402 RepID=A0AAW2VGN5_9LAMI
MGGSRSKVSVTHTMVTTQRNSSTSKACQRPSWSFLWSAKIPPKIKMFLWRLSKDALPTGYNLRPRKLSNVEGCPVCKVEEEDVRHAMIMCDVARQVWVLSAIPWRVIGSWDVNTEEWLLHLS